MLEARWLWASCSILTVNSIFLRNVAIQAEREYKKAAMQGHKWARYNLALICLRDTSKDCRVCLGHHLLHKSAEEGLVEVGL